MLVIAIALLALDFCPEWKTMHFSGLPYAWIMIWPSQDTSRRRVFRQQIETRTIKRSDRNEISTEHTGIQEMSIFIIFPGISYCLEYLWFGPLTQDTHQGGRVFHNNKLRQLLLSRVLIAIAARFLSNFFFVLNLFGCDKQESSCQSSPTEALVWSLARNDKMYAPHGVSGNEYEIVMNYTRNKKTFCVLERKWQLDPASCGKASFWLEMDCSKSQRIPFPCIACREQYPSSSNCFRVVGKIERENEFGVDFHCTIISLWTMIVIIDCIIAEWHICRHKTTTLLTMQNVWFLLCEIATVWWAGRLIPFPSMYVSTLGYY